MAYEINLRYEVFGMWKWTKRSIIGLALVGITGYLFLGQDVYSYVSSSSRMLQESVVEKVPFEFQIRRARDLLADLVPQMHANIRLIAKEEVEINDLEVQVRDQHKGLNKEKTRLQSLREALREDKVSYDFGRTTYTKAEVVDELGRRFDNFQTSEVLLKSKEKLLSNRRMALRAAQKKLEKMRVSRIQLEADIEQLESQFRLVQAEAATSRIDLDDGKMAQINTVLTDLRKRLEVSQRVLAHESKFVENIPVDDVVNESSLLESFDTHFSDSSAGEAVADEDPSI